MRIGTRWNFVWMAVPAAVLCAAVVVAMDDAKTATGGDVAPAHEEDIARGHYLIKVGGCNDCHTPGFMQAPGQIPEALWLTGSPLGWRGPWGTTYPSNLRLFVGETSEDDWVEICRSRDSSPPMPWFSLNALTEADARAIYRYIASLGPAGVKMPKALGPNEEPTTPYLSLEPHDVGADHAVKELRMERPPQ